jgi:hypothetical protein
MPTDRILRELAILLEGGQVAELFSEGQGFVVYRAVPTGGARLRLPETTDVIVPVPSGYPASLIDLAGLTIDSPFLTKVKGGQNSQGIHDVAGVKWQLASYHPHANGGGPPWDQMRHGFHTYFDHLISWLERLD